MLHVGPESAGATPGPICYARGGTRPTITDANLVLGRLNPDKLLSVQNPVPMARIRELMVEHVGAPLGLDADAAAAAILRIANDKMAGAIRMVSLARGHDPRDFALFAFGGAGPLHAAALAKELAIPKVLIPARPGLTNALGCTVADVRHDYVRTINLPLAEVAPARMAEVFKSQIEIGRATIVRENVAVERIETVHRADMQFQGQSHILTVAIDDLSISLDELRNAFEAAYWQRFGVELSEIRPVLVNLHTAVIGKRKPVALKSIAAAAPRAKLAEAQTGRREVWFDGGRMDTPVYRREWLPEGAKLDGPAIIEQLDCTTVIEPGNHAELDAIGNLLVSV
jgi:N-methylhydantoinase A